MRQEKIVCTEAIINHKMLPRKQTVTVAQYYDQIQALANSIRVKVPRRKTMTCNCFMKTLGHTWQT